MVQLNERPKFRDANRSRLKHEFAALLWSVMGHKELDADDLAELSGLSLNTVKRILGGTHNSDLNLMADITAVLGMAVHFSLSMLPEQEKKKEEESA
jgi:hypothetical protein